MQTFSLFMHIFRFNILSIVSSVARANRELSTCDVTSYYSSSSSQTTLQSVHTIPQARLNSNFSTRRRIPAVLISPNWNVCSLKKLFINLTNIHTDRLHSTSSIVFLSTKYISSNWSEKKWANLSSTKINHCTDLKAVCFSRSQIYIYFFFICSFQTLW